MPSPAYASRFWSTSLVRPRQKQLLQLQPPHLQPQNPVGLVLVDGMSMAAELGLGGVAQPPAGLVDEEGEGITLGLKVAKQKSTEGKDEAVCDMTLARKFHKCHP